MDKLQRPRLGVKSPEQARVDVTTAFLAAGFALVEIPLGTKGPTTKEWQKRENAVFGVEYASRFTNINAGLVHEHSKTCAIDVDDVITAAEWFAARGVNLSALLAAENAVTVSSGTTNRAKLLYRAPELLPTKKVAGADGMIVEFRCEGAQDVVAGKHPNGTAYTVDGDVAKMPDLPAELLTLWREPPISKVPVGGNGGVIPEGVRNDTLFQLARGMHRRGAPEAAIVAALREMNKQCRPPLPDRELDAIGRSAVTLADRSPSTPLGDDRDDRDDQFPTLSERVSQSERIVRIALEGYTLHRSETDEPYALRRHGPKVALPLRGTRTSVRPVLARQYHETHHRVPSASALTDAMNVLEGHALDAPVLPTHLRVARHERGIAIDLGRADGRVVLVTPNGWDVVDPLPIVWRRTRLIGELPLPVHGGSLNELRTLVPLADDTWPLAYGWLVAACMPDIAHPVMYLSGQHGTGKSTVARTLVSLIDPSPAPVRGAPRDVEGWAVAASASWMVAIDNISTISPWWSDAICRAVTGEGLVRRALYADTEVSVLAYRRCIIATSIDAGALRGDLGDRILLVDLEPIEPGRRRADTDLDGALAAARPRILGALFDLVAQVLTELPRVHLAELPRMADFARILAAIDSVLGTDSFRRYVAQAARVAADVVEGDPVGTAIRELGQWSGSAGQLHLRLTPEHPPRGWPTIPRLLTARLRHLAPALLAMGIRVQIGEHTRDGTPVLIEKVGARPSQKSYPHLVELRELADQGDENAKDKLADEVRRILADQRRALRAVPDRCKSE